MAEVYPILHEGIRNGSTFYLDTATQTAIKDDPNSISGKVVTITGNNEVGYGTSGDAPLGFVVIPENYQTNSTKWVVGVQWNQAREDIACTGVSAGNYLAVNGTGGFAKSTTATNAKAYTVSTDGKTCAAYIGG